MATALWSDVRVLPLLLFFVLFAAKDISALTWTNRLANGSTIHQCTGDDAVFAWSYDAQGEPNVTLILWYSKKNGTIANILFNNFVAYSDRVTYIPNAGITLSGLTSEDSGTYGVELIGTELLSLQELRLVAVERPTAVDAHIFVKKESRHATSSGNDMYDLQTELQCGQFLSTGYPAVSAEWTDPDGKPLPSTGYHNGFFSLVLPRNHKGGNYTCSVLLDSEMAKCRGNQYSLKATSASIFVETTETKLKDQSKSIELLKTKVQHALKLQNETDHQIIEDIADIITSLESAVENVTEDMNRQHQSAQNISDIKYEGLRGSLENLKQSLLDKVSGLREELKNVSSAVSNQTASSADQQQVIIDKKKQLEDLERRLEKEQRLSSQLEAKVASLFTMLSDQKDEFDGKMQTQEQEINLQKEVNSQLTNDLADLKSRLVTLTKTLESQEASLTNLNIRVGIQQHERDAQIEARDKEREADIAAQKQTNSQMETRLAALQNGLLEQNTSVQSLGERLEDAVEAQEKKHSDLHTAVNFLRQTMNNAVSNTTSRLSALGDALHATQQNLTDAFKGVRIQQHERDAQIEARDKEREADIAAQKQTNSQMETRLAALQNGLLEQNTSVQSLGERLEDAVEAQEKKHSDLHTAVNFLRQTMNNAVSNTTSRLSALGDALHATQQNLTDAFKGVRIQQHERDAQIEARDKEREADIAAQKQTNSQMETRLAALQNGLLEQNTSVQSLGERLEDAVEAQEKKHSDLHTAVNFLRQTMNNAVSNTTSRLSALGDALHATQQNLTDAFKGVRIQQHERDAQVEARDKEREADIAAQKQTNSQMETRLAALQNGLLEQNTSVQSLGERLEDAVEAQEKKHSDLHTAVNFLRQTMNNAVSNTTSRLSALGDALHATQQNLTDAFKASQVEQTENLRISLQTSVQVQSRVTHNLQADLTKLESRVEQLAVSGSGDLSKLQRKVNDNGNKFGSLQRRVQTVEEGLRTASNKIVRLVGGANQREGRVEILLGNTWGTVCDDSWDNDDAKVVCHMLGFFGRATARTKAAFGAGSGSILLDDVVCTGYELDIRACKVRAVDHNCNHNEDAGVVCS